MPEWDDIFAERGRFFTEPHADIERVVRVFRNHDVERVLDLGCGTGRHLVYLAKSKFEVHGFDVSPKALSLARDWLEEECLTAHLLRHRMEDPFPFEDDFFDAVISTQVIHHNRIDGIRFTVSEIERVLRRDGVLFVTFPRLSQVPDSGSMDWKLEPIEPGTYIPRSGPEAGILHHYFTVEEVHEVFRGFKILDLYVGHTGHRCLLGVKE